MKALALLYLLHCPVCEPELVAAYFNADAQAICTATAAAQNATESEEYYCELPRAL